jgi:hypothetical protein
MDERRFYHGAVYGHVSVSAVALVSQALGIEVMLVLVDCYIGYDGVRITSHFTGLLFIPG